jgi:hypothetical protein
MVGRWWAAKFFGGVARFFLRARGFFEQRDVFRNDFLIFIFLIKLFSRKNSNLYF